MKARYHIARALGIGKSVICSHDELAVKGKLLDPASPIYPKKPARHAEYINQRHDQKDIHAEAFAVCNSKFLHLFP
jgi:hypothetical protein